MIKPGSRAAADVLLGLAFTFWFIGSPPANVLGSALAATGASIWVAMSHRRDTSITSERKR